MTFNVWRGVNKARGKDRKRKKERKKERERERKREKDYIWSYYVCFITLHSQLFLQLLIASALHATMCN